MNVHGNIDVTPEVSREVGVLKIDTSHYHNTPRWLGSVYDYRYVVSSIIKMTGMSYRYTKCYI